MVLLLFSSFCYSQRDGFCATPPSTTPDPPGIYSQSTDTNYFNSFSKKTFNIFFWRINKSDGSYTQPGWPITLERVKDGVKRINEQFAPLNICFVLVGMDTINSTAHHSGASLGAIKLYAAQKGKVKSSAFNVYAPHTLSRGSGQSGYYSTSLAINSSQVDSGTVFAHELGHSFNLIHTFGNSNDKPPTICERVTRNPLDTFYNAHEAGDKIVDTDAVPNFQREQHVHFANALNEANIGYTWYQAWNIAFLPNGFRDQLDAIAIEQALVDYGFFQSEINYLKYNPAKNDAYTDIENCIYNPDSRINDPISQFFKDCGGTPYQISTGDIRNFMAYSTTSCDRVFTTGQKVRVHEAIEMTDSPLQAAITDNNLDLYLRDSETDIGQEPNIHTDILWNSKDIWVRNQNDGTVVQQHQNPIYSPINPNYVYVKVRNKGCGTSSGNEQLKLYWAKASTALNWDDYWTGQIFFNGVSMGDELGTLSIPVLAPDEEAILEFQWNVPNPQDYIEINPNPWHFCLLARMVSNEDPMTFHEVTSITENVRLRNNLPFLITLLITF